MQRLVFLLTIVSLFLLPTSSAMALPVLQLYIEGATYDAGSETWLTTSGTSRVWVVGNFNSGESILDVRLSLAFSALESGTFSLTPTTTTFGGVTDTDPPPQSPTLQYTGFGSAPADLDGDSDIDLTPVMSDGSNISNHGIYGPGTNWNQYQLGDMTLWNESPIGDFQTVFPTLGPDTGEIFAYDLTVTGFQSGVHLDAFNHVEPAIGNGGSIFAPYSHDAAIVPEPGSLALLGAGLLIGLGLRRRRK